MENGKWSDFMLRGIFVIALTALLLILFFPAQINNFLNKIFNPVERTCQKAEACKPVSFTSCERPNCLCEPETAVNRNWKKLCIFPNFHLWKNLFGYRKAECKCTFEIKDYEGKCVEGICKLKKLTNTG